MFWKRANGKADGIQEMFDVDDLLPLPQYSDRTHPIEFGCTTRIPKNQ
jgi:hypothetical protein